MEVTVQQQKGKPGPKRGRPDETKVPLGLRIYYSDRMKIEEKHGGMQAFFDKVVEQELTNDESCNTQD